MNGFSLMSIFLSWIVEKGYLDHGVVDQGTADQQRESDQLDVGVMSPSRCDDEYDEKDPYINALFVFSRSEMMAGEARTLPQGRCGRRRNK